uniref:G-protein coupled receptors family 1 profile domain-containing protein n=1 Tax=Acrobeloides nanus TaxID=290746 RepID=A0A914ECG3_9BILA
MTNCRRPTKVEKANRKEFFILIQSVLLCGVFELENVILSLMPTLRASLSNSDVVTVLSFSQAWINILGNTIHAIVIFFFNSLAREVFYVLIGRKKSISVNVSKATAVKVNASKAVTIKVQPAATRRQTVL